MALEETKCDGLKFSRLVAEALIRTAGDKDCIIEGLEDLERLIENYLLGTTPRVKPEEHYEIIVTVKTLYLNFRDGDLAALELPGKHLPKLTIVFL